MPRKVTQVGVTYNGRKRGGERSQINTAMDDPATEGVSTRHNTTPVYDGANPQTLSEWNDVTDGHIPLSPTPPSERSKDKQILARKIRVKDAAKMTSVRGSKEPLQEEDIEDDWVESQRLLQNQPTSGDLSVFIPVCVCKIRNHC